jgi:hypothetical protein
MVQPSRWRPFLRVGAALICLWAAGGFASSAVHASAGQTAAGQTDAVLYRIFLRDGGTLVSYGDFARVAERVVVSIPIGGTNSNPVLHLVTIADKDVDWERTDAYAHAARARRYADTRGEHDFARLTREVADTLYQAGLVEDAAKRVELAESARKQLVEWPQQHYGYRAEDLAGMTSWLDQVVSELRVAAGLSGFELTLVARAPTALPAVQLLPAPDFRERTEFAIAAARKAADPAERVSLFRAVLDSLQLAAPDGSWMSALRTQISSELAAELTIDRAYSELAKKTLSRAGWYAARADVRGLESLVRSVLDEDQKLRRSRPADITGLLAVLDARIDAARRFRLARDAWALRAALIRSYWQEIRQGLDKLLGVRLWLTDVRQLAGPSPSALRRLAYDAESAGHQLAKIRAPAEVAAAHSTLAAASGMAVRAARTRLDALRSGSMEVAWEASSAAAGSLLLLDQAVKDLRRITREPAPRLAR